MRLNPAGAQVLFDLLSDRFPNARNALQPSIPADLLDILCQGFDSPCSSAVSYYLEAILCMQLQELCHLVENASNLAVLDGIDHKNGLITCGIRIMLSKEALLYASIQKYLSDR